MAKKVLILNETQIQQKINRIAYEIYENCSHEKELIIAGIAGGGYKLAERLNKVVVKISGLKTKLIEIKLDKKDPYSTQPKINLDPKDYKDKVVIVVDDVLNSGKTLIFGVKYFLQAPIKRLLTVVLVDRNHTRYPVKVDFTGTSLSTTIQEHISVELGGKGKDAVYLL